VNSKAAFGCVSLADAAFRRGVSIEAHARKSLITRTRATCEKRYEGIGRLKTVAADGWIEVEATASRNA
jgi:hypothetical protein